MAMKPPYVSKVRSRHGTHTSHIISLNVLDGRFRVDVRPFVPHAATHPTIRMPLPQAVIREIIDDAEWALYPDGTVKRLK